MRTRCHVRNRWCLFSCSNKNGSDNLIGSTRSSYPAHISEPSDEDYKTLLSEIYATKLRLILQSDKLFPVNSEVDTQFFKRSRRERRKAGGPQRPGIRNTCHLLFGVCRTDIAHFVEHSAMFVAPRIHHADNRHERLAQLR